MKLLKSSVLIVEDEPLIAWMLEDVVSSLGLDVIGPFPSIKQASSYLQDVTPEIALLDVNLIDGEIYPVADQLEGRKVPLIFHTANVKGDDLAVRYEGAQVIMKPSDPQRLRQAIDAARDASAGMPA
ncbi:response regulator [Rhizobium sp. C4]|uniref:response regulator n=1 Tax=Rhizobium sp. C4 TaxID=1349800 RepID=UPI001E3994CD|nr:response regulator [Rhizobium sp. C4]MCD2174175.1 response regulator [Rhizobium sp. C4]